MLKCGMHGQRAPYLTACSMPRTWRSYTNRCGSNIPMGRSLTILWTSRLYRHQTYCIWKFCHPVINKSDVYVIVRVQTCSTVLAAAHVGCSIIFLSLFPARLIHKGVVTKQLIYVIYHLCFQTQNTIQVRLPYVSLKVFCVLFCIVVNFKFLHIVNICRTQN